MKRSVFDSSSRSNVTFCPGGAAVHPRGTSRRTVVSAGPRVSFTTVTRISRSAAGRPAVAADADCDEAARVDRMDADGTIATSGDTRSENAGTTSSALRFSPLKTSP